MEKLNEKQNSAFPVINQQSKYDSIGMSKLFYAACKAMQGLLSNAKIAETLYSYSIDNKKEIEYIIKASYKFANEILKQEYECEKYIPTDEEVEKWFDENIGYDKDKPCSASSAIYKFRIWLKERV